MSPSVESALTWVGRPAWPRVRRDRVPAAHHLRVAAPDGLRRTGRPDRTPSAAWRTCGVAGRSLMPRSHEPSEASSAAWTRSANGTATSSSRRRPGARVRLPSGRTGPSGIGDSSEHSMRTSSAVDRLAGAIGTVSSAPARTGWLPPGAAGPPPSRGSSPRRRHQPDCGRPSAIPIATRRDAGSPPESISGRVGGVVRQEPSLCPPSS